MLSAELLFAVIKFVLTWREMRKTQRAQHRIKQLYDELQNGISFQKLLFKWINVEPYAGYYSQIQINYTNALWRKQEFKKQNGCESEGEIIKIGMSERIEEWSFSTVFGNFTNIAWCSPIIVNVCFIQWAL